MDLTLTAADGTRLAVRRSGRGGEPIILVHGSSGGLDSWGPLLPHLADEFAVWVYARRGYAPSDTRLDATSFSDHAGDLLAVLTAAGGTAHVVGASLGATVALHAALRAGVGMRSLTLFEPPLFAAGPAMADVLEGHRALVAAGQAAAAAHLFASQVARVPADLLEALAHGAPPDEDELVGCEHDLVAMAGDVADCQRWCGIDVPVLLLQGGETWHPVPEAMAELAGALPAATRAVLPGQSHFATHTAPELFAGALLPFLRRIR